MKRKTAYGIFIAAFFILCLIPSAGMLLFGESEAAANEILSPRPVIFQEDGSFNQNFTDDLTSYIADRFAFRQEFITAYAKIQAALFKESSSGDVVLGKDGWLFYQDTVDDYLHHNALSGRQIQGIARTLSMMQQYAEERGVRFVFTVAPNKNSLYPEYMPDVGDVFSGEKNLDMLEDVLDDYGIRYADLREAFEDQPVLYYRRIPTGTAGERLWGWPVLQSSWMRKLIRGSMSRTGWRKTIRVTFTRCSILPERNWKRMRSLTENSDFPIWTAGREKR